MFKRWIKRSLIKLHAAHPAAHAVYFAAVAVEAGKWYGAVAGVLLIITLAEMISRISGGED